jgi:hypothetical protein
MKERLACLLSEIGESFDYMKSDVRNHSRYMTQLEDVLERYRAFVSKATFSTPTDQAELRKLLKKTQKIIGPLSDKPSELSSTGDRETEKVVPGSEEQIRRSNGQKRG